MKLENSALHVLLEYYSQVYQREEKPFSWQTCNQGFVHAVFFSRDVSHEPLINFSFMALHMLHPGVTRVHEKMCSRNIEKKLSS